MAQLGFPTIFSHTLEIDAEGNVLNYHLRQKDQKRHAVAALKGLQFQVLAAGDSYNDISMLQEADAGIFYRPPDSIRSEYPQFPVAQSYEELKRELCRAGGMKS
jgi:phosphoserine/homoserine phosphotransferase